MQNELSDLTDKQLIEYYKLFEDGLTESRRFEKNKIHNTDLKFLYHLIRLLDECEQILMYGTVDLRRNREQLKAIRRGDLSKDEIFKWASSKEIQLEALFVKSTLPEKPRVDEIKRLLIKCLDYHYSSLKDCIELPDKYKQTLQEVKAIIDKTGV
jgi:hypothetical protein